MFLNFLSFMKLALVSIFIMSGFFYSGVVVGAAGELVIYSGRSSKFLKPVVVEFTKATGIKASIYAGSSSLLLNKLKVDKSKTDADIYISDDIVNLYRGNKMNLFSPVTNKIAAVIKPQFRGKDNYWLGLSARAYVLVLNTKAADIDFITSIFDLADPRLEGRIAISHRRNESYISAVTTYRLSAGNNKTSQWLKDLRKNTKGHFFSHQNRLIWSVAKGKKAVGLVEHSWIYQYLNKHPNAPIRILIPDQKNSEAEPMGLVWSISGAAITKYSKRKKLAMKFMAYVSSVEGQRIFSKLNYEYPARNDMPAASMLPVIDTLKASPIPMYTLSEERKKTIELIRLTHSR